MAETAPAPAAAPAKAPKKKATKAKKPGPSVSDLILKTVTASNERKGVSLAALKKALAGGGYDVEKNNSRVKIALKSLVKKGALVQTKGTGASGSFKVSKKPAAKKPVKKVVAKPKKPAVKKAAAKAAKPKKAAVKKPAPKKSPKKVKKAAAPKKATKSPKKVKKPAVKKVAKSPKKVKAVKPKTVKAKAAKPKAAKAKKTAAKKKYVRMQTGVTKEVSISKVCGVTMVRHQLITEVNRLNRIPRAQLPASQEAGKRFAEFCIKCINNRIQGRVRPPTPHKHIESCLIDTWDLPGVVEARVSKKPAAKKPVKKVVAKPKKPAVKKAAAKAAKPKKAAVKKPAPKKSPKKVKKAAAPKKATKSPKKVKKPAVKKVAKSPKKVKAVKPKTVKAKAAKPKAAKAKKTAAKKK
ncbi:histone H1.11R-like [Carassius auratus]|uniref:Histone H1 n=2 Tax=Carassius TaxID=7956 RepID=A0A6P6K9B1_CARAU|nr:histone H1.11R-like [Carassius auratus]